MAADSRIDLRASEEMVKLLKAAAEKDRRSLSNFILNVMEPHARKILNGAVQENPPVVQASAPAVPAAPVTPPRRPAYGSAARAARLAGR